MVKKRKTKVYFTASLSGKKTYQKQYDSILHTLKKNDTDVITYINDDSWENKEARSKKDAKLVYKRALRAIDKADLVIVDMTYASPAVAMEIQDAIHKYKKPVLMLTHISNSGTPGAPFWGNPSKLLEIKKYELNELESIIKSFLQKVEDRILSVKYTVRIDAELDRFLEFSKLELGETSKNQVILELLRNEMEKNTKFQKFTNLINKA